MSGVRIIGAVAIFIVLVFGVHLMYGLITAPVREVVGSAENASTNAPPSVYDHVRGAWVVAPIIIVIVLSVWLVMYAFRREREVGFR